MVNENMLMILICVLFIAHAHNQLPCEEKASPIILGKSMNKLLYLYFSQFFLLLLIIYKQFINTLAITAWDNSRLIACRNFCIPRHLLCLQKQFTFMTGLLTG